MVYPQMPPFTEEEIIQFLAAPRIARLACMNEDGSIHLAPMLYSYKDGDILLGTQDISRKIKNIKRNPNVTVLIDNDAPPFQAVLIYGKAALLYDDVVEQRVEIFKHYMLPEDAQGLAEGLATLYVPVLIRVTPERIISHDYSKPGFIQLAS